MKLRVRVFFALLIVLIITFVGVGFLGKQKGIHPLEERLLMSRADVVLTIATEIELSKRPYVKAKALSKRLGVYHRFTVAPLVDIHPRGKKIEKDGRIVHVGRSAKRPMLIKVNLSGEELWMVVIFPAEKREPGQTLLLALLWLSIVCIVGSWALSRWTIRPIEVAANAMNKIANGELSHRVDQPIGMAGIAFNRMAERVESLLKGQKKWIAAISHELRTPITRLRLQVEMLDDQSLMDSMLEDVDELEVLLGSMLASARLNAEAIPLNIEAIQIHTLILDVLGDVELHEREIDLLVDINMSVEGDRDLLLRVFTNLLSNISRYTPKDCEVKIQILERQKAVYFEVSDSGKGVPEEFLPIIFDSFVREEESRSRITGGLGLGLMLVKQIIERHNGEIKVQNKPTGGLSIEWTFPLTQPKNQ